VSLDILTSTLRNIILSIFQNFEYRCHRKDRIINVKITQRLFYFIFVSVYGSKLKWNNILRFLQLVFSFLKIGKLWSHENDLPGYENFGLPKLASLFPSCFSYSLLKYATIGKKNQCNTMLY